MEGQEKNMAQLKRIGAAIEWRWSSEEENRKEKNRDDKKGSNDGPRESQEKKTLLSASC